MSVGSSIFFPTFIQRNQYTSGRSNKSIFPACLSDGNSGSSSLYNNPTLARWGETVRLHRYLRKRTSEQADPIVAVDRRPYNHTSISAKQKWRNLKQYGGNNIHILPAVRATVIPAPSALPTNLIPTA